MALCLIPDEVVAGLECGRQFVTARNPPHEGLPSAEERSRLAIIHAG